MDVLSITHLVRYAAVLTASLLAFILATGFLFDALLSVRFDDDRGVATAAPADSPASDSAPAPDSTQSAAPDQPETAIAVAEGADADPGEPAPAATAPIESDGTDVGETTVQQVAVAPVSEQPGDSEQPSFVATVAVNVRAGPSNQSEVIGRLSTGEEVHVTANNGGWMQVAVNGVDLGWVYGRYLIAAN